MITKLLVLYLYNSASHDFPDCISKRRHEKKEQKREVALQSRCEDESEVLDHRLVRRENPCVLAAIRALDVRRSAAGPPLPIVTLP